MGILVSSGACAQSPFALIRRTTHGYSRRLHVNRPARVAVHLVASLCLGLLGFTSSSAPGKALDFPKSPVTIIVPFPPGASTDQLARAVQPGLQANLGQPVVIENKSGASGTVGAAAIARATPDGHTIGIVPNLVTTVFPYFYKSRSFNAMRDLAPITVATRGIVGLVVHSSLPVHSLADLIAYGKQHDLSFATGGAGSPHQLFGEMLARRAHFKITHIPYKGSEPATRDVVAGHVKVGVFTLSSVLPLVSEGMIRIIAIGEKTRFASLPNVPAVEEMFPDFEVTQWNGFYAPVRTPKEVITRLNEELVKVLTEPTVKSQLADLGLLVIADKPEDVVKRQNEEFARWGPVIRDMNIEPQ